MIIVILSENELPVYVRYLNCIKYDIKICHKYLAIPVLIKTSGVATGGGQGGSLPPLTAKNLLKIRKKSGKIGEKEEKSGRKGRNQEGSFTLPLLTDRAGYATD